MYQCAGQGASPGLLHGVMAETKGEAVTKGMGPIYERENVLFAWSGGKDSAMALHELLKGQGHEVVALLTTVTEGYDRVSMHGVRRELLRGQADSLGLPLDEISLTPAAADDEFEERMREKLERYRQRGVVSVAFGDIFLEDIRRYREGNLSKIGMKGIFPIWHRDTAALARAFVSLGFKAVVTCVDSHVLDKAFVGREFDERFLLELPGTVDPCGEKGEFHSFVYDGPIFRREVSFVKGDVVLRENRFYFCDLIPLPRGEGLMP